jgi:hypothetical protein
VPVPLRRFVPGLAGAEPRLRGHVVGGRGASLSSVGQLRSISRPLEPEPHEATGRRLEPTD